MIKRLTGQGIKFIVVSGCGWLIDFGVYLCLTHFLGLLVGFANFISAIPAVTFVFFTSTKRIFSTKESRISLHSKYIIYLLYQFIFVIAISSLGQLLYNAALPHLSLYGFAESLGKIAIKIIITPLTMVINFMVMKLLTERI